MSLEIGNTKVLWTMEVIGTIMGGCGTFGLSTLYLFCRLIIGFHWRERNCTLIISTYSVAP
jgi:hypothetical protein